MILLAPAVYQVMAIFGQESPGKKHQVTTAAHSTTALAAAVEELV